MKTIRGIYHPPPDKSITHRALFLAALARGTSVIRNPLATGDCLSTLKALQKLGVSIRKRPGVWTVTGRKGGVQTRPYKPRGVIDCGNSGTTIRLLTGILSSRNISAILSGDSSLRKRPMRRVIEPLRKMGAKISARQDNFAPIRIENRTGRFETRPYLHGITWRMRVASAQVKSAILLAGLFTKGKTTVTEPSRSRDHTERMLKSMGAKIEFSRTGALNKPNRVSISGGGELKGIHLTVPGDFSSAAFFISAALIVPGSHLFIKNVNLNFTRIGFLIVLKKMGARFRLRNITTQGGEPVGEIEVKYSRLKGVQVSKDEIPSMIDEIPILAIVASQAQGKTIVSGAEELRVKESDRLAAIVSELSKMGAQIKERKDGFIIQGPCVLRGASCDSFGDHRMAMSLAVAGLVSKGKISIKDFGCTRVSYPNFLNDLSKLSS